MADKDDMNPTQKELSSSKGYNLSDKPGKLSALEKVVSYPARVAILGGAALGQAGDQALYNAGVRSPKFNKATVEGKGYDVAKKLGRKAIGLDSLDDEESTGKKKGGRVKKMSTGGDTGAGAGRGKQGGPTAKEMEYRYSADYMSPDTENKIKEEQRFKKMSAESPSQKYAKGGTASSRADGIAMRGHTKGKYL